MKYKKLIIQDLTPQMVELIVEKSDWIPPAPKYAADSLIPLRIEGYEKDLQSKAKAAGGRWNPEKQLWFVHYGKIAGTPLEKHIQADEKDNNSRRQTGSADASPLPHDVDRKNEKAPF